ncbi:MAG: ABC transporter ATP-binding protein [Spirochaetia bacterium]|jgi:ABC-type Fe3+/spermidine/putrescine transport system ATPase subunit
MSEWMIELKGTTKRYGMLLANDHIDLRIPRGELLTLLGPSGCGKTTAMRCITGHQRPDEGRVLIDGRDVTDLPTHKRDLGMVFQNFALFPHMTVYENVDFPLMIRSLPHEERRQRVTDALRLVRMDELADRYPRQLSGGQQQRVGLARALVYRPSVLLLDEPLSNLDAKLREEMRFEIKELVTQLHMTAVYVTHDQGEALALSDRVAVMKAGRIQQIGTPREIFEQPNSLFVADFIGLSDFIKARVEAVETKSVWVAVKGLRVRVQTEALLRVGQEVTLFIRPTRVDLLEQGAPAGENVFAARVLKLTYLGDNIDYRVVLPGDWEIRVQTNGQQYIPAGSSIKVRLPAKFCHIIAE